MTSTTLAIQVREVFTRFASIAAGANQHNNQSVLRCWNDTFPPSRGVTFYEAMALVSRSLERLDGQVTRSRYLDDQMRPLATNVVAGLKHCILPEIFHQNVGQVVAHYNSERLATLGMMAGILKLEFPEPTIPATDLEKLQANVDEVLEAIAQADFLGDQKALLLRHASQLAWIIANIDKVGIEPANDAIAQNLLTIERMTQKGDEKSASPKSVLLRNWKAILLVLSGFTMAATEVHNALDAIVHVKEDVKTLEE